MGKHQKPAGRKSTIAFWDGLRYNHRADVEETPINLNTHLLTATTPGLGNGMQRLMPGFWVMMKLLKGLLKDSGNCFIPG
jgi:hypothetical protein